MSDFGGILDAIATAAEGAVAGLDAERGLRLAKDLAPGELPHLFLYDPQESVERFPHGQKRITTSCALELVARDTQEALALKLDAIRDAIETDETLGGLVRWAYVSTRGIREDPSDPLRYGDLVVVAVAET